MKSSRFRHANGREVIELVTASGIIGYVDASIPFEVMEGWHRQLSLNLRRAIARSRSAFRQERRRRRIAVRRLIRRPRRCWRVTPQAGRRLLVPRR